MKLEIRGMIFNLLTDCFLKKSTTTSFISIYEHCVEFLSYLFILNDPQTVTAFFPYSNKTALLLIIILSTLIIVRIYTGISFIKAFYPVTLFVTMHGLSSDTLTVVCPILLLLTILVVGDVLSNTKLDFSPLSITAETINSPKLIHVLLIIFGVIQRILFNNAVCLIALGVGFALLAVLKASSIVSNESLKEILIRCYLLLSINHWTRAFGGWVTLPLFFQFLVPLVISQLLFQLYELKRARPTLDELYSQERFFELSLIVCNYWNGETENKKLQQEIFHLLQDSHMLQIEFLKEEDQNNLVYQKLIALLTRNRSFQSDLLLAEIYTVCHHQLLKSRHLIESLKKETTWNLNQKILIYRLQETLEECFQRQRGKVCFQFEEHFNKCDQFRSDLLKSAVLHINFWEYSKLQQIDSDRLMGLGIRVVDLEEEIMSRFEALPRRCITLTLLYISYLYHVVHKVKMAKNILEELSLNEENIINLEIKDRVFIQIGLEEDDRFKILRIGSNMSLLLGYQRKEVEGQPFKMFLPAFYHQSHHEIVQKTLEDNLTFLHLFNKKVIIKNQMNYYQECNAVFRLHHILGESLSIQGFLNVRTNPQYIWTDFLFVNEAEEIVECSPSFSELLPGVSKLPKAQEFFTKEVQLKGSNFHHDNQYYPLVIFNLENDYVTYFVRKNPNKIDASKVMSENLVEMMREIKYIPLDETVRTKYHDRMKQVLASLASNERVILFLLGLALFGGIFALEGLLHTSMMGNQSDQKMMLNKTSELIYYANNFTEMGFLFCYQDMSQQIDYQNDFTFPEKMVKDSLTLQELNQRLKSFSIDKYTIPSTLRTYQMTSYEITVEFCSSLIMLSKFKEDATMVSMITGRLRVSLNLMWFYTYFRMRNTYLIQLGILSSDVRNLPFESGQVKIPENNLPVLFTFIGIIFLFLILLFVLVLRIDFKNRQQAQQTLSVLANAGCQGELISTSLLFVSRVTREKIRSTKHESSFNSTFRKEQTSFAPDSTNRDPMKSQTSMRELSNRNLMDDTLNKSLFLESKLKKEDKKQEGVAVEVSIPKRRVKLILIPLLGLLLMMTVLVMNVVRNGVLSTLDNKKSAENVFNFFQQTGNYSYRLAKFLNYLNLRLAGRSVDSSKYRVVSADYDRVKTVVNFEEVKFKEFYPFEQSLIKLQLQYFCAFMECDPRYKDEINIIFSSTIIKLFNKINQYIDTVKKLDSEAIRQELTKPDVKFDLDTMYYYEIILRQCFTSLLDLYQQCYLVFSNDLTFSIYLLDVITVVITMAALALWVLFLMSIAGKQQHLDKMLSIGRPVESELESQDGAEPVLS